MKNTALLLVVLLAPIYALAQASMGGWDPNEVQKASDAADAFKTDQPKLQAYFDSAYA